MKMEFKPVKAEVHQLRSEKLSLEQEYNDLKKTRDEVRLIYFISGPPERIFWLIS